MAGHSKWKNIAHRKAKEDAKKGKVFTKFGREMAVAIKEQGSADPSVNTRLKDLIAKAKANNVPNDNINRLLAKFSGGGDGISYEAITYEGYGAGGTAVIVETLTENRNRTASEMRLYFDKYGGNLGTTGCVSWQFDKKGVLVLERGEIDEDELILLALDLGAADVMTDEEVFEVYTEPEAFPAVCQGLTNAGFHFLEADLQLVPQTYVAISDEDAIKNMEKLLDLLEDNDDVQNIYHNWDS